MGVMGRLPRFDSIPYSIGLPYSYTIPSCTRPTSICTIVLLQAAKRHGQEVGFDGGVVGVVRNRLSQTTQTSFKTSF